MQKLGSWEVQICGCTRQGLKVIPNLADTAFFKSMPPRKRKRKVMTSIKTNHPLRQWLPTFFSGDSNRGLLAITAAPMALCTII